MFPRELRKSVVLPVNGNAAVGCVDGVDSWRVGMADCECYVGWRIERENKGCSVVRDLREVIQGEGAWCVGRCWVG